MVGSNTEDHTLGVCDLPHQTVVQTRAELPDEEPFEVWSKHQRPAQDQDLVGVMALADGAEASVEGGQQHDMGSLRAS